MEKSVLELSMLPGDGDHCLQCGRKLTRDEDSSVMIDLIREGIICDFGMAFYQALSSEMMFFESIIQTKSFNTWWAANENGLHAKLDTLLETLAALDTEE